MSVYPKDKIRVNHILDSIKQLIKLSDGKSFQDFSSETILQLACIKLLEIIGEASNHISQSTKDSFSQIPWKQIIGLRNILVHEYFGVDHFTIWDIIQHNIKPLKVQFLDVLIYLS